MEDGFNAHVIVDRLSNKTMCLSLKTKLGY